MGREVVFIVSSETPVGVLQSQVFAKANYIGEVINNNVKVILVGDDAGIFLKDNQYPNIEIQFLGKEVQISEIKNSILYVRTIDVFLKYFFVLKINKNILIYDFRAFLFAESFNRNKSYIRLISIFLMELLVYLLADQICAVSNQLKSRLRLFFLIKRKVFVFPCLGFIDLKANTPTEKNNKTIDFVYLGGLSEWQKFDKILKYYKALSKEINNTTLTVITKNIEDAKRMVSKENIRCTIKSLENHEVFEELTKYDFGFLVRENNLINNVASPIKFLEYLIAGVIPIMNEGIGDYSNETKINKIGYVLDYGDQIDKNQLLRIFKDPKIHSRIIDHLSNYDYKKRIENHPLITLYLSN